MVAISHDRPLFFQSQLRYLITETIAIHVQGQEDSPVPTEHQMGELLFRASELLYERSDPPRDLLDLEAHLASHFFPSYEISEFNDAHLQFIRLYIMLKDNLPRIDPGRIKFKIDDLFLAEFGFSVRTYYQFIWALVTIRINHEIQWKPGDIPEPQIQVSAFNRTKLSPVLLETLFNEVSFNLDFAGSVKARAGFADFEFLKDRPFFRFEGSLYCLDYDFAFGKFESGVIWRLLRRINEQLGKKAGNGYLALWGQVFEDHISLLFATYCSPNKNRYYPSPEFGKGGGRELCDGIMVCGRIAILMEYKLATCPIKVRYSGDFTLMKEYLEEALVAGKQRKAGVSQLVNAIDLLLGSRVIREFPWLSQVTTLIPVIVTKDEIGSSFCINSYLDRRFDQMLDRKRFRAFSITPLLSISISTLERLLTSLGSTALSDILSARIHANKDLRKPLEMALAGYSFGGSKGLELHVKAMQQLTDDLIKDFGMFE